MRKKRAGAIFFLWRERLAGLEEGKKKGGSTQELSPTKNIKGTGSYFTLLLLKTGKRRGKKRKEEVRQDNRPSREGKGSRTASPLAEREGKIAFCPPSSKEGGGKKKGTEKGQ